MFCSTEHFFLKKTSPTLEKKKWKEINLLLRFQIKEESILKVFVFKLKMSVSYVCVSGCQTHGLWFYLMPSSLRKFVVYIKSTKDKARGDALLGRALTGRSTIVDMFIETSVRKNYKPELDKAVQKCNARSAKLIIPNIGHLPRSLAFCNAVMKLDGNEPYVCAIRETDGHVAVYKYHVMQMFLQ